MPTSGTGQTLWMIDNLGFDLRFLVMLSLISTALNFSACFCPPLLVKPSIPCVVVFHSLVANPPLYLQTVGMYCGQAE